MPIALPSTRNDTPGAVFVEKTAAVPVAREERQLLPSQLHPAGGGGAGGGNGSGGGGRGTGDGGGGGRGDGGGGGGKDVAPADRDKQSSSGKTRVNIGVCAEAHIKAESLSLCEGGIRTCVTSLSGHTPIKQSSHRALIEITYPPTPLQVQF